MKYHDIEDPIRKFNEVLGGKWRLLILERLIDGTQRFSEIQQSIPGITPRMLTKEIRSLTNYGIVQKEVFKEMPPRVEYTLSNYGIKLFPLIEHIRNFGKNYTDNEQLILEEKEFELVDELKLPNISFLKTTPPKAKKTTPYKKQKVNVKSETNERSSEVVQESFHQLSLF